MNKKGKWEESPITTIFGVFNPSWHPDDYQRLVVAPLRKRLTECRANPIEVGGVIESVRKKWPQILSEGIKQAVELAIGEAIVAGLVAWSKEPIDQWAIAETASSVAKEQALKRIANRHGLQKPVKFQNRRKFPLGDVAALIGSLEQEEVEAQKLKVEVQQAARLLMANGKKLSFRQVVIEMKKLKASDTKRVDTERHLLLKQIEKRANGDDGMEAFKAWCAEIIEQKT